MAKDNQLFEDLSEPAVQAGEQNMQKARGASFLQNISGRNDLKVATDATKPFRMST